MPDRPEIQLPAELLPIDGRFGSGPSKVRLESLLELGVSGSTYMGTSHRQDRVKKVVHRIRAGLSELYNLPAGFEVLLGVGGATAFWDAAAFGLIERRSQHLVFGEFSAKFASVVAGAPHLDEPELIESDPGTHPHPAARQDVDVYAFTHNETSTGVMMPIARPEGADGLVVVDATSAAGAAHADVDQFDVYYFSPQKAFGSSGWRRRNGGSHPFSTSAPPSTTRARIRRTTRRLWRRCSCSTGRSPSCTSSAASIGP
jgi:phosphoserine aminotransferase